MRLDGHAGFELVRSPSPGDLAVLVTSTDDPDASPSFPHGFRVTEMRGPDPSRWYFAGYRTVRPGDTCPELEPVGWSTGPVIERVSYYRVGA